MCGCVIAEGKFFYLYLCSVGPHFCLASIAYSSTCKDDTARAIALYKTAIEFF